MTSISKIYNELKVTELNLDLSLSYGNNKNAVIFGSARTKRDNHYYDLALQISEMLSSKGYNIITGGGGGIMEAGNRGCISGTASIGLNILLDHEQEPNPYQNVSLHYESFLSRKHGFFKDTDIFIVMPGGFGTLDEFFEVLTLIQCGKIKKVPVVLVDSYYYQPLVIFIREMLIKQGNISEEDLSLITVVDSVEDIEELL